MIDLTVKTLDSQNHAFSLADDITIREFKEHIASTVNVAADSQRLIYCGRVLQDEKHLSDYDVNGKVIHLVHRAPPQSAQRGNSSGQSQSQGQNDQGQNQGHTFRHTRAQFHGNPMYLGSISIPAEVVEGHELPLPQLSITLATSRTMTARRMLQEANLVLDRLEGGTAAGRSAASETTTASKGAASRTDGAGAADSGSSDLSVSENDESASGTDRNSDLPQVALDFLDLFLPDHATSAESNAAYQIAAGFYRAVRNSQNPETRASNDGTPGTEPPAAASETTDENQSASQDQQQQSPRQERVNGDNENNRASGQNQGTMPMATLLRQLMDTEDRLRPHLLLYRQLMLTDPVIPSENIGTGENQINLVERNQRLIDSVSECLHYLAHANHALSDVIVDLGQQPPRNLRCRPVLIHQSTILQGSIPIQVEAHISVARNDGSQGENGEENTESANRPPTSTAGAPTGAQMPTDMASDQSETMSSTPTPQSEQQQQQQEQQQQAHDHPQVNSTIGAIFNLTNNMEVLMEMAPSENGGGITVRGMAATGTQPSQNNGSNNNNNVNINNNAPGASGVAGMIPWGPAPPPGLIQNLMNAVAGYMAQSAGNAAAAANVSTPTTTSTTPPPGHYLRRRVLTGAARRASRNPGQSTQARSNVGTHPTTSTQTRSTSRPHVFHPHAHPLSVGMGHNMDFDILLPCNSHHIRRAQPSATPNNSTATSSPQQTSQPSQSTTPNGVVPPQPEGSTTLAGSVFNATPGRSETNVRLRDQIAKLGRSDGTESENAVTFEQLLLSRGISTCPERLPEGSLLRQLYTACAKIEISEWYALINNGKFNRVETWRRLRTQLTSLMSFTGKLCASSFVSRISMEIESYFLNIWGLDDGGPPIVGGQTMIEGINLKNLIEEFLREPATYIEENVGVTDEEWGSNLTAIVQRRAREMCTILRRSLNRIPAGLEKFIRKLALRASSNQHPELRDWIVESVAQWFCEYSRPREGELDAEDARIDGTPEMPIFGDIAGILRTHVIQPQPEPEPMETEEASGTRVINDPLDVDDGEEVPTSFPGHEQLLPEWVPIIARDSVRQRRQLQLQGEGMTGFSDAYLEGLPSKRRKLVERLKPRLLVNPAPNQSVIAASVERLVRESVFGASVEEADGSAAAVAADPGVRRAFGQAIRECLNPRRLESSIFPDARRFPNATRYFSDKDKPAKQ